MRNSDFYEYKKKMNVLNDSNDLNQEYNTLVIEKAMSCKVYEKPIETSDLKGGFI